MRMALCAAAILAATLVVGSTAAAAPLAYAGGTYMQNFDGLPMTGTDSLDGYGPHEFSALTAVSTIGMEGWQLANPGGDGGDTEFRAHDGSLFSGSGRGVVSFGTTDSAERALGALPTGNQISSFGLVLTNDTAETLTEIAVSYTGEQWRRGDIDEPATLTFAYGLASGIDGALTDVPELTFASVNTDLVAINTALNGNDPANQSALSHTIVGLNWAPGETLAIRWTMSETGGQDDGLAIDNLSFTAVPEPGTVVLAALGAFGVVLVTLRKRSAGRAAV